MTCSMPTGGSLSFTARAEPTTWADPDMANDSATATTTIPAQADLRVTLAGYDRTLTGDGLRYTTTVTNNGPAATAYVLSYDIGLVAGSGSCWLDVYSGDPSGTKPLLAPGASPDAVFDFFCEVTEGSRVEFLGHAVTAGGVFDPNERNNTGRKETLVCIRC